METEPDFTACRMDRRDGHGTMPGATADAKGSAVLPKIVNLAPTWCPGLAPQETPTTEDVKGRRAPPVPPGNPFQEMGEPRSEAGSPHRVVQFLPEAFDAKTNSRSGEQAGRSSEDDVRTREGCGVRHV